MSLSNFPPIKIGGLEFSIIQGAMGVNISGWNLVSSVIENGGLGVIPAVGLGSHIRGLSYEKASEEGFRETIRAVRKRTNGPLGANIMHVLTNYASLVKVAVEEKVEVIISGAGAPRDLPRLVEGTNTLIIPKVSSPELAETMCISWARRGHLPDAIVYEGPEAGGHLGFNRKELNDTYFVSHNLEEAIPKVVEVVRKYETLTHKIPVIAAGGLFYGGDIAKVIKLGAAGAKIATRLVTTNECDAALPFKEAYLMCEKKDIEIIDSPVGMPGRAIMNQFLREVSAGKKRPNNCPYKCLRPCDSEKVPYCIADALLNAQEGNLQDGFAFIGAKGYLCKEIIPVKELFRRLDQEYKEGKVSN